MANELFQAALQRRVQKVPPVWFMRQAGRYHKHYQALRARYGFMELCKIPEVAAEVALGPIEDFDFDVSILFSDLLFPLEALGMGLSYEPAPTLGWHLTPATLSHLAPLEEAWPRLDFQKKAVQATRALLPKSKSLIGFVGGPWTLYTYAVEGAHKGSLVASKSQPNLYQAFSERLMPLLQKNIELQLEGGAEIVMVFDTAAGELSPLAFRTWVVPHLERLAGLFPGRLGYYSKCTQAAHLDGLRASGAWAGFGFDHGWSLPQVLVGSASGFVQGNFDQALLFLPAPELRVFLQNFFKPFQEIGPEGRRGWVCGLGHGVLPQTPEENVRLFVQTVRETFA